MLGQMVPCGGGEPIALRRHTLFVGRTPDCDVTLPFGTVSSKHCRLDLKDGTWHVTDLGSRNGIRVDGVKCPTGKLAPGSVLSVAQHRFQFDYQPNGQAAVPPQTAARPAPTIPVRSAISETTIVTVLPASPGAARSPGQAAPGKPVSKAGQALGQLVPCGGGEPIALRKEKLLVGRLPNCDIPLASSLVSGKHCELEFKEGFWHVRDLGSRNGIRVGSEPCLSGYLRPGDVLTIARLRFEISYVPQGDEPPPDENPFAMSLMEKAGLMKRGEATPSGGRLPADDGERKKKWTIG